MNLSSIPDSTSTRPYVLIGGGGFLGTAFGNYLGNKKIPSHTILRNDLDKDTAASQMDAPVIVDFAYTSLPNTSYNDPVKDFSENLNNIIRHLDFARKIPNATFVYISSGGTVYGNTTHEPVDEVYPNVPLSPYGISKLACEKYVLMYKAVYGLDIRIVRPSNIYGPGQKPFRGQGLVATAIAKIINNDPIQVFGDGSSVRDYLYLSDFCALLYDVITKGKDGEIYNAGSGEGLSITAVLSLVNKFNEGVSGVINYVPARPFDVQYNVLNTAKARSLANWVPAISNEEGFRKTIHWMKQYLASQSKS